MGSLFDKIEAEAFRKGYAKRSKEAQKWFLDKTKNMGQIPMNKLLTDKRVTQKQRPRVGDMFHFTYDPKHRTTLPYYDRFPLIIMVQKAPGGFYGLNLHYLPPKVRAIFLDKLTEVASNKKFDESTRLKINYNLIKGANKYKYFKPCFKHYLTEHVDSKIVKIDASEWDIAIFLPTENFAKARKNKVWKDSRGMY